MIRFFLSLLVCGPFLFSCTNNERGTAQKHAAAGSVNKNALPAAPATEPAKAGDVEQSLSALEKRYALVSSDPAIAYDLAYAYAEQKNPKALKLADSLIKAKAPEPEKAYYIKADYFNRTNNVNEALKAYDAAVAANLHFLDAQLDKGRLLYQQKQYAGALRAFATGQKLSPAEPMFYFWTAKTQEAMGDNQNAKANYERAYALDKNLTDAKEAAERL